MRSAAPTQQIISFQLKHCLNTTKKVLLANMRNCQFKPNTANSEAADDCVRPF